MAASHDTEITLSTGRMLVLFFCLVALCGLFFGLGYSLGHAASKPVAANAVETHKSESQATTSDKPAAPKAAPEEQLSFYQAVKQNDTDAQPAANPPLTAASARASDLSPAPDERRPPTLKTVNQAGFYVQVAAVTKKEDANALMSALRKKSYAVLIASNEPHDHLYHVQVGPFRDLRNAESARARLVADGYNPILKK
jgi:cell division septation protein DedD